MKAVILLALVAVAAARPEAPLDRRYLPPGASHGHRNGGSQGHRGTFIGQTAPAPQYGPPGYQNGSPIRATEDPLAVPASYKFAYKVLDEEAGLDFGHEEAREGDEATGEYRVLLPDGRTQIVTYVANNDGYQPQIRYEEPKGGYSRGPTGAY